MTEKQVAAPKAQVVSPKKASGKDIVVRVLDVKRYYGQGDTVTKALDGISLDI